MGLRAHWTQRRKGPVNLRMGKSKVSTQTETHGRVKKNRTEKPKSMGYSK